MSLDRDVQLFLEETTVPDAKDISEMTVLEVRALGHGFELLQGEGEQVASVRDILVDGAGGSLPARVFHPHPGEELPVLVYFHGGGWVMGDIDVVDKPCRALANAAGCVIVAVNYRKSPETKFPGPAEDCYAATLWVAAHAAELGGTSRWVAVAGDSAGANLATVVTHMARDRNAPNLAFQLLLYPTVAPAHNSAFESYRTNGEGYQTTAASMRWFYEQYLQDPLTAVGNPYVFPLHATDLSRLPPAHVVTAGYDPLRDEGQAYAEALSSAGVPTTSTNYSGVIHGFFWVPERISEGRRLVGDLAQVLRQQHQASIN
jgi:acetyl esterase